MRLEAHVGLVTPPEVAAAMRRDGQVAVTIPDWLVDSDISSNAFRGYSAILSFADTKDRTE